MQHQNSNRGDNKISELRKQAEAILSTREGIENDPELLDIKRVLAELHVHQIELEIQNEELRQTQVLLAVEREKYADLYNFAPVAYFTFDHNGIILDLNMAAADLLEHTPKYLTNHPITPYLTPESLQAFVAHRHKVMVTHQAQICELTLRLKSSNQVIVQVRSVALDTRPGEKATWRSVMTDVTERKQVEARLREQATWSRFISDAVIVTDSNLIITGWNEAATKIYGWNIAEATGREIDELLETEFIGVTKTEARDTLSRDGLWRGQIKQRTKKGELRYIEASVTYLRGEHDKIIGGITVNRDITENKLTDEKLRESEERFRQFVEQGSEGISIIDEAGIVVAWNSALEKITGLSRSETVGRDFKAIQVELALDSQRDPELIERQNRFIMNALRSGDPQYFNKTISSPYRRADGEIRFIQQMIFLIKTSQGHQIGMLSRDITEQKQADEKLQESEARYRRLVDGAPGIVYTYSSKRGGIYYSPYVEKVLGYSPDYLCTHPFLWNESIHPDDLSVVGEAIRRFEAGNPFEVEYRVRDAAGQWVWLLDRSIGSQVEGDELFIEGLAIDITQSKLADQAIRESEFRYRSLFTHAQEAILITNSTGQYVDANPSALSLLGFSREELLRLDYSGVTPAEYQAQAKELWQELTDAKIQNGEYVFKRKDGTLLIADYQAVTNFLPGRHLITLRDITERKQAEEKLKESEQRYRSLFKDNHAVMLLLDPETGQVMDANSAACNYYGYSLDELKQLHITDINTLSDEQVKNEMQQVALDKRRHFLFRHRLRTGEVRDVEVYSGPMDMGGKRLLYSIVHDITERKRAENVEKARVRVIEFASKNPLTALLQYSLDELCSSTGSSIGFFHFIEDDQKTISLQAWSTFTLEEMCKADGKRKHYNLDEAGVWVDCVRSGRPVVHNDYANLPHRKGLPEGHAPVIREMVFPITRNEKIVAIIGVGNKSQDYEESDVAYAMQLADMLWEVVERKRSEQKLGESEERFRTLVSSMDDIVFTLDTQQRHTGVYGDWVKRSGLTPEFFMGKTVREIFGPDAALVHEEANLQALNGRTAVYEWSATNSNGVLHYQTSVSPLLNEDGHVVGIVGVGRDITVRKLAEEALRDANEELQVQLEEIQSLQEKLREQAIRDPLTGLFNRRYLQETLEREVARARRSRQPVGIMIMDIDHFKLINDRYGHDGGDLMLRELGNLINASIRMDDIPCRTGGEEFVIIMPGASIQAAHERANILREKFDLMQIDYNKQKMHATISIGVTAFPIHGSTGDEVLIHADRALYQSKQNGRNRVTVFHDSIRTPRPW